jgi:prefoldin subunit 5
VLHAIEKRYKRHESMNPERESEVESLTEAFERFRRLAERFEAENVQLAKRVAELEQQYDALQSQQAQRPRFTLADGDANTTEYIDRLQAEFEQLEAQHRSLAQEYAHLDRQNSNYLSLYVASSQFHATLDFEDVLRNIKEIVINLIGADRFSIYLYDESAQEFRRVASEGQVAAEDEVILVGENLLSRVARSGSLCLDTNADLPSGNTPIAILPLAVGSQRIGLLVLFRLLVQKDDFDAFDMELFDLLSAHAATALLSSTLYRRLERKNKTLQGLLDLFKAGGAPDPGTVG